MLSSTLLFSDLFYFFFQSKYDGSMWRYFFIALFHINVDKKKAFAKIWHQKLRETRIAEDRILIAGDRILI